MVRPVVGASAETMDGRLLTWRAPRPAVRTGGPRAWGRRRRGPRSTARAGDGGGIEPARATPGYGPIPTAFGAIPTAMGLPTTVLVVVSITVTLLLRALAT